MREESPEEAVVALPVPCVDGCLAVGGPDMQARAYRDGPVLIRGARLVLAPDGTPTPALRAVVAVCRCGHSKLGVYCDGTHRFAQAR
jgi:hypothetical protein